MKLHNYWNTVWDNPITLRRIHGWLTIGWATQVALVSISGKVRESLVYLVIISVVTAFLSQLASWQAARVEVKQMKMMERLERVLSALDDQSDADIPSAPQEA